MLAEKRTAGTQKCGLSHVQAEEDPADSSLRESDHTAMAPCRYWAPGAKNLQDNPFAAEKYWQDWESGLNGKVPQDGRPPSDWDGWDAPGAGDGTPPPTTSAAGDSAHDGTNHVDALSLGTRS